MLLRLWRRFRAGRVDPVEFARGRVAQLALMNQYRQMATQGVPLPSFADAGFKAYSQNDEDGILLMIFALVGATNRFCIELAAGEGSECISANLILNHGFSGLLFESRPFWVKKGREFFARHPATAAFPPRWVEGWITRENVDAQLCKHLLPGSVGPSGEIDLLTIDLDGNDYWILQAIRSVTPRVVVVEFNALWGAERAVSVPYDPGFKAELAPVFYGGASLLAFVKLLRGRDYRLVGIERHGFNAFFVRNDLRPDLLPEVEASRCLEGATVSICQAGLRADPTLAASAKARPWVEV